MDESSNWVVQNLQNALATWNDKLSETSLSVGKSFIKSYAAVCLKGAIIA